MAWNAFGRFGGDALAVRGADDIRLDRRCFADEVVVDFPSVAPAVERIRHAFAAEDHARTLTAALEITPREAMEGATVPRTMRPSMAVVNGTSCSVRPAA